MERKSSFESRNKRKLLSDGENKRKRHKGGASNQHKMDGDIRMETIIYKLDSRNKIVLPRADETNTDNEFLQYVKARIEEKSSPTDNGNGRRHSKTQKHERTRNSKRYNYDSDTSMEEHSTKYARNSTSKEHRGSKHGRYSHADDHDDGQRMSYVYEKRPSNGYERNVGTCSCTRRNNSVAAPQEQSAAPVNRRYSRADDYDNDEGRLSHIYDKRPSNGYDRNTGFCSCTQRKASLAMPQDMAYPREQSVAPVNGQHFCELSEEQMLQCFQLVFRKLCTLQNANGQRLEIDVATTSPTENPVNYNGQRASSAPIENPLPVENPTTNTQVYAVPEAISPTRSPRTTPPAQTLPHPQAPPQPERTPGNGMVQKAYFYPSHPKRDFSEPVETRVLGKQFDVNEQQIASTGDNQSESYPRQSSGVGERLIEVPLENQNQYGDPMEQHYEQQQQTQQYEQEHPNPLEAFDEHGSLVLMENYPTEFNRESMQFTHPPRRSTQSGTAGTTDLQSLEGGYVQNRGSQQLIAAEQQQSFAPQQPGSGSPQQIHQPHDPNLQVFMGVKSSNPADFTGTIGKHSYQSGPRPMTFPVAPNLNPNSLLRQNTAQPNTSYPIYPYGFKNGLQKLSADSVRIIPNVTVVDYNETCCSIPICSPVSNESYEYILMRVKKNKHG